MSENNREEIESKEPGKMAPYTLFGKLDEDFDQASLNQLTSACGLPVSAAAALMPDAHVGYGLPIGGVLATRNAVIPYAVGVDIACRMKLTVLDLPVVSLEHEHTRKKLIRALETQTVFGVGAQAKPRLEHEVMDRDWSVSPVTAHNKDKAWSQLGTSGSGNHFVEFGKLTIGNEGGDMKQVAGLDLAPGTYLAVLSHSGSRGTGAAVCERYSKLAMDIRSPGNKKASDLARLAWLDLDSTEGQEYWNAMNLMGHYAAANHATIHRRIAKFLGAEVLLDIENHHNFAWKEKHVIDGKEEELIVHRKGATPAGAGVLGIIPGSMAAPGFVVAGKGNAASLHSASHGAGRAMSRAKAKESMVWGNVKRELAAKQVTLLSAGIDEAPGAYKDIHAVMAKQTELVDVLARFDPAIVKMADGGEKAED